MGAMKVSILGKTATTRDWLTKRYRLNVFGVAGGSVGFLLAILPSLIPRPGLFMGVLAGVCFMIGYGLAVLVQKVIYWMIDRRPPRKYGKNVVWTVGWLAVVVMVGFSFVADEWQDEIRILVGEEPSPGTGMLWILLGFVVTASLILWLTRLIRGLYRVVLERAKRWDRMPKRVAILVGAAMATFLLFTIVDGVFLGTIKVIADNYFRSVNERTGDKSRKPTTKLRSGSDESLVRWETLGRNGRDFVGSGPSARDIAGFTGREAKEPIRVYVSAYQADTPRSRAELAVKELFRTGAFDRKYLIISTTTGSGWVEPASAASVEYLHGGDTAHVALQYSYLPSWMALLVSQQDATDSGRALFEAIFTELRQMPEDRRPKVVTTGLSLGAFGSQGAFTSASDFAMRVDGALYFGGPGFSQPWREFTENRDAGSLQIKPVYRSGEIVRFANNRSDLLRVSEDWSDSRVLFVQYPSDAIVWWTTDLIWHRPDWINEPRGADVSERVRWFPVVTFLQIVVDQMFGNHFTGGHGHNYAPDVVHSWAAVTPVSNWEQQDLDRLQSLMNRQYTTVEPGGNGD